MITLIVKYHCKENARQVFVDEIKEKKILDKIIGEKGYVEYAYYLSVEDPNELVLLEKWETKKDQQIHLEQAHMQELKKIKEVYVDSTEVEVF